MTRLVLCAPLGVEARALRRGGSRRGAPTTVVRTGMGPTRSARWGRDLGARLGADSGVAVAGVCGGVGPDVRPGDVVVASEVRGPDGVIELPAAPLLAGDLRRRGFPRVHVGPVASRPGVVTGDERAQLGAEGVLAVDTESTWLLARLGDRPRAVVRVVVDTAEHPLAHAGTVRRGVAALRTLSRLRAVLDEWSAVLGPRQVLLAGPRSFCAGVDRAIEIVERALAMHGAPVYVRKQIVHNAHVVGELERRGAVFVEEIDEIPPGSVVVFSAHGVSPAVRVDAEGRGLRVVDATCPLVAKVHAEARRFATRGDTVVLIGHAGHEEPEGTLGEAPESTVLVETVEDARALTLPDPRRAAYLMQTTLSVEESAEVVGVLRERFPDIQEPGGDDICYATTNRQLAVREVARDSELVLVVGSRNSSNSLRLVETAQREGAAAHLVDDAGEVDLAWLSGVRRVGVTAGASAPPALVDGLVRALGGLGPVEVEDRQVTTESVQFTLPKEVRG